MPGSDLQCVQGAVSSDSALSPAGASWAWLSREKGTLGELEPRRVPELMELQAASEDTALSGPQSQNQLSCPVFCKGWLLKVGSPPGKQMFSTMLTK